VGAAVEYARRLGRLGSEREEKIVLTYKREGEKNEISLIGVVQEVSNT
jgi:hypothetical protein